MPSTRYWIAPDCSVYDDAGRRFDPWAGCWSDAPQSGQSGRAVDAVKALGAVLKGGDVVRRLPIGVIGPRAASDAQMVTAEELGTRLGAMGFTVGETIALPLAMREMTRSERAPASAVRLCATPRSFCATNRCRTSTRDCGFRCTPRPQPFTGAQGRASSL